MVVDGNFRPAFNVDPGQSTAHAADGYLHNVHSATIARTLTDDSLQGYRMYHLRIKHPDGSWKTMDNAGSTLELVFQEEMQTSLPKPAINGLFLSTTSRATTAAACLGDIILDDSRTCLCRESRSQDIATRHTRAYTKQKMFTLITLV